MSQCETCHRAKHRCGGYDECHIAAIDYWKDRSSDAHSTCNGSCDIALARRQVGPDGYVPGNARECAEMWEREAARVYNERDTALRERNEAGEAALLPIRRALSARGFCGDGGLTSMVIRALEESQERGRAENREVLAALLEASDAFPPEMEGTVAARVKEIITEITALRASIAAAREAHGDPLSVAVMDSVRTEEREAIAAWIEGKAERWCAGFVGPSAAGTADGIAAAIRAGEHRPRES